MKLNVQSKNNVATGIAGEDEKMKYNKFPLTKINFIMMAVSGLLIIAGFMLMLGGANGGATFNDDIFSTRRVVIGPTMAFMGFVAMGVSIIYKSRKD